MQRVMHNAYYYAQQNEKLRQYLIFHVISFVNQMLHNKVQCIYKTLKLYACNRPWIPIEL
jgi:hypothetical protein